MERTSTSIGTDPRGSWEPRGRGRRTKPKQMTLVTQAAYQAEAKAASAREAAQRAARDEPDSVQAAVLQRRAESFQQLADNANVWRAVLAATRIQANARRRRALRENAHVWRAVHAAKRIQANARRRRALREMEAKRSAEVEASGAEATDDAEGRAEAPCAGVRWNVFCMCSTWRGRTARRRGVDSRATPPPNASREPGRSHGQQNLISPSREGTVSSSAIVASVGANTSTAEAASSESCGVSETVQYI